MDRPVDGLGNVSRETIADLERFASLIVKWNQKINLIARSTEVDIWTRHIVDGGQIFRNAQCSNDWLDIGSGGGLPGLVVGILQKAQGVPTNLNLIESDQRKCAFLRSAIRELGINATVHASRIENTQISAAKTISARALAPLTMLLSYQVQFGTFDGQGLFLKGKNWKIEVEKAEEKWCFDYDVIQSVTDPASVVLRTSKVQQRVVDA